MKEEIGRILRDHKHLMLNDDQNASYLAGLISEMIDHRMKDYEENHRVWSVEDVYGADDDYVEHDGKVYKKAKYYKELSEGIVDEVRYDGDGKKLDEPIPSHKRRVKSYGFFKNTYHDD